MTNMQTQADTDARVQRLHKDTYIFDGLATSYLDRDYIQLLTQVGVNAVHYTVAFTSLVHGQNIEDDFVTACRSIGRWNRIMEENKDKAALATSIAEMERIGREGKIAIFYGFQNGSPIENNIDYLKLFYQMGVRFIMLTYNKRNFIGSGGGESRDSGLSDFGVQVVREMNKLGIAVDLSHCGDTTSWEAIEVSSKPCLFTHANVKALAPTPRNKSDELIRFCVSKGGLIGPKHMLGNLRTKLAEETTVEDYVDQIDYLVNLVGIESVSLGTDFSGTIHSLAQANAEIEMIRALHPNAYIGRRAKPKGFERIDGLFQVTHSLIRRGYSDGDIANIYSGNLCRVLRQIFHETE